MTELTDRWTDVGGLHTRYYEAGSGADAVVLLHGGEPGESPAADTWRSNVGPLGAHFRTYALDRASQGFTDNFAGPDDYRVSNITRHVIAFLDEVVGSPCTLVGQSRGAFVAVHVARRRPDLVRALVLTNSASLAPAYSPDKHRADHGAILGGPENARRDLAWLAAGSDHLDDAFVKHVEDMLATPKNMTARADFQTASPDYFAEYAIQKNDVLDWLREGNLAVPSLLMWGLRDNMTYLQDGLDVFELLRAGSAPARMYLMTNSGHSPFIEHADEFNALVTNFVQINGA